MASPARPEGHYSFGVFTVDLRSGELRKHGIRVKLQERPFQLLVALMETPGETVTREELRQRLWPDGTFVNFDQSISSSVNKLRSALNDSSTHPRFIETVGRRGYRFLADVRLVSANEVLTEEKPDGSIASAAPVEMPLNASHRWTVPLATAAIMAAALAGLFLWGHSRTRSAAPAGRVMLAVLPFENLTGDASQDYFSDGLTEEMITQLGQLDPQRLGVIARTSVMTYKHRQEQIEQIGRELGVQYVLEGSVRRDANTVRITAQLIQVKDQTHLWARQYDRELKDLLLLQGEIAHEIADETQIAFTDKEPTTPIAHSSLTPQAYEAYNLYLQGQFFWNKRTVKGLQEAIQYFEQATAKDPNCARAYAGMADSYCPDERL